MRSQLCSRILFDMGVSPHDFSLDLCLLYGKRNLEIRRFRDRFSKRAFGISHWNVDFSAKLGFIRRTINFSLNLKRGLKG